jgi:type VI protein secretion system component Hcp
MRRFGIALYSIFLGTAAVGHAAQPVGSLACATGETQSLSFNVSFFDLGLSNSSSTGGASTGAGAGKATYNPLIVHAALSTFPSLADAAATGEHYTTCTLTTQTSSGETIEFILKNVEVQSANAVASSATGQLPRYAFVRAELDFESLEIEYRQTGGVDDGGVGPTTGGGDIQQNSSQ